MHLRKVLVGGLMTSSLFFVGCGNDSTDAGTGSAATLTGTFVDSNVSGLGYTCSSGASGFTTSEGKFTCNSDDTVTFNIGALVLGSTKAADIITPYDLHSDDDAAETLINVLQLLQKLDDDNNASNGINITEGKRNLFSDYAGTIDDAHFDANASVVAGVLVTPANALKHFNETLTQMGASKVGFRAISNTYYLGEELRSKTSYTYDDNGRLTQERYYNGNEEEPRTTYFYTYDENGNKLTESYQEEGTKYLDSDYTYDEKGNRTQYRYRFDEEGIPSYVYDYTYDVNGNKVTEKSTLDDTIRYVYSYTYHDNGAIKTRSYDYLGNNTIENEYTYNEIGQELKGIFYYYPDGMKTISRYYENTYADNGKIATSNDYEYEEGVLDTNETTKYTYNSLGDIKKEEYFYTSGDQIISDEPYNTIEYTNTYENNTKVQSYTLFGTSYVNTEKYDAFGNITEMSRTQNEFINYKSIYTYDENGNILSRDEYYNSSNTPYRSEIFTYDENGNVTNYSYKYSWDDEWHTYGSEWSFGKLPNDDDENYHSGPA